MNEPERSPFREALLDAWEGVRGAPWRKIMAWSGVAILVLAVLSVVAVLLVVQHYSRDLPDVANLENEYAPPQVTRILARDGTLLANVFSERRTVVPFDKIPDHLKSAVLAAEDAGFYEHEGLDYLGMLRAMVVNLRAGYVKQGGSTITQQVVKNVLLDHERSYRRKIRETILAYRIEKFLSKDRILAMYMNHIYLGHGRYGVQEAAKYLFGKDVGELDVAESALLAGIVASPERYSPRRSEEKARARREYVLGQMLRKGFMTQSVHEAAVDAPLRLSPTVETESHIAPELVRHAKRLLKKLAGESASRGGFTVVTTIDPEQQVAARQALRAGLDDYLRRQKLAPPYTLEERRLWGPVFEGMPRQHRIYVGKVVSRDDQAGTIQVRVGDVVGTLNLRDEDRYNPRHLAPTRFAGPEAALRVRLLDDPATASADHPVRLRLELGPQGAVVAIDPRTREVLAAAGSYEAVEGGLDRTVQARRQPGSTFKPLVYSYALSTGEVTPAARFEFEEAKKPADQGEDQDGEGKVVLSLRQGIARSDNRVARQVFRQVGAQQVVEWSHALGITSPLGADESLALGSYEVAPLEMANAFATFASGGKVMDPQFFLSVKRGSSPISLPNQPPARQVVDPAVAFVMTDLLTSVIQEGTGRRAASLGRPLAGKTGTTNDAKDAWFVGYSTDLVVAVWVGFDDAHPLGWGESGATSALPIWIDVMKAAHEGKPSTEFPRPPSVVEAELDPETGLLAAYGQENTVTEVFVQGTVPEETADSLGAGGASPSDDAPRRGHSGVDLHERERPAPNHATDGNAPPPPF